MWNTHFPRSAPPARARRNSLGLPGSRKWTRAFAEAAAGDELEAWRDAAGEFASLFAARFEDEADEVDDDPHQLTVVSEIEAETPSPEADQNLRLALSIERLNGDLSGERDAMDHRSLALRWCAAPATAEHELRARFFGALRSMVAGHASVRGQASVRGHAGARGYAIGRGQARGPGQGGA